MVHGHPDKGGHSIVNISFCSSMIKRNSVSSKMLEAPYRERNIIISLSSFCAHGLTVCLTLRTQLTIATPRENIWEYNPGTCSQKFRLWPLWTAPHICTPCLYTLGARSLTRQIRFSQAQVTTRPAILFFHSRNDKMGGFVSTIQHGSSKAGTKNPVWLVSLASL